MSFDVRDATPDDAPAIAAIYNAGIASRRSTFDTEPCPVEEIAADLRADERPLGDAAAPAEDDR